MAARILIAEDDPENREALRLMLELSGFVCLEAADGAGALRIALQENPELVLTDISLPELDGFEVVTQLRSQDFKHPIIVISAYDDEAFQQRARVAGANHYLTKPLEFDLLKNTIDELLSKQ